ncbi:MAG: hydroxyphenylacetyl-CoA thioesterase PaaI [Candidatus Bathyarchaeia archaeon]
MSSGMVDVRRMIESDRFMKYMGIQLLELREGYSKLAMTITGNMINLHNVAHGGAIFTLADAAFAAAGNSHGQKALALNMNINYCSPATEGMRLIAEAYEENLGRRTGLYRIIVRSEDGRLIAASQGLVYRKNADKPSEG